MQMSLSPFPQIRIMSKALKHEHCEGELKKHEPKLLSINK